MACCSRAAVMAAIVAIIEAAGRRAMRFIGPAAAAIASAIAIASIGTAPALATSPPSPRP